MNKTLDKLKNKVKFDKKIGLFLVIITVVGIIAGSIFVTILNSEDSNLIYNHLNDFLNNIENNNINYTLILKNNLLTNLIYVLLLWLLGISVIGLPIIIILYFSKAFILGFSVGSIISVFKARGIVFALAYVFPSQVISLIAFLIITVYAISFSLKLIYSILKKTTINFKLIINKYIAILLLMLFIIILMNLYDTYLMPNIVKLFIHFIR